MPPYLLVFNILLHIGGVLQVIDGVVDRIINVENVIANNKKNYDSNEFTTTVT